MKLSFHMFDIAAHRRYGDRAHRPGKGPLNLVELWDRGERMRPHQRQQGRERETAEATDTEDEAPDYVLPGDIIEEFEQHRAAEPDAAAAAADEEILPPPSGPSSSSVAAAAALVADATAPF